MPPSRGSKRSTEAVSQAVTMLIIAVVAVTLAIAIALWAGGLIWTFLGFEEVEVISNPETARKAIDDAETAIESAEEAIRIGKMERLNVSAAEVLLNKSKSRLDTAIVALSDGKYELTESLADESKQLAQSAASTAENALMVLIGRKQEAETAIAKAAIARRDTLDALKEVQKLAGAG